MDIFYKELRPNYNVIDIRDNIDYEKGHYINSINIPYLYLLNNPDRYLLKSLTYYIYCYKGNRSKKVVELLNALGYNIINVKDGYKE